MLLQTVKWPGPVAPLPKSNGNPPPNLTEEEKQELDTWQKRHQNELGLLHTPPVGPADPQILVAKAYVQQLVRDLAGDALKGKQLRIELFTGDVPQAALDDSTEQERNWEEQHPDKPWPIRTWLEAPKEGNKPLYRLVLSEGLLRHLQSREELGFVLAHELARLIEHDKLDPNNETELEPSSRSWLDTREQQVGADAVALDMMVKANLNPQGALSALDRMYRAYAPKYFPKDDQKTAVAAAAQGSEHEGLRIAALQAQVEQLRRSGKPATLQPITPLPPALVPDGPAFYDTHVADFPRFQKAFEDVATQLATDSTPAWMFGTQPPPPEVAYLRGIKGSTQDYERALAATCDSLTKNVSDPQLRVNGFLRTLLALKGDCLPAGLAPERVREFLASNKDFQAQPFFDSLSQGKSLHREFVTKINLNPTFQAILAPLPVEHAGMADVGRLAAANYTRKPETGELDLDSLSVFLRKNNDEARPLQSLHNQGALQFVSGLDPAQLAAENHQVGLPKGLVLCNDFRALDNLPPDFGVQLRTASQPIQDASNAVREDNARLRLRPPLAEPAKLNAYLQELFESEHGAGFTPQFESQLPALLLDVVRVANHQPDLVTDTDRPRELVDGLERRLCQLSEKDEAVRYISRQWSHEQRVPTHSPRRDWTAQLAKHFETLPDEQLFAPADLSQHAELIKKSLIEGYRLTEQDVPDVSTATLEKLDERRQAGEFTPKREDYPDEATYALEMKAYRERCDKLEKAVHFLAPAESRLTLSKFAMFGHDGETSLKLASRLEPAAFEAVLGQAEEAVKRSKVMHRVFSDDFDFEPVGTDVGAFLLDGFLKVEAQIPELQRFYDLAQRVTHLCPPALESRPDTKSRFADSLFGRLKPLEAPQLREWLGKENVLDALKPNQSAQLLIKTLGDLVKPGADPVALGQAVADLDKTLKLQEKYPVAYILMRDEVAEKAKLQPSTHELVFPPDPRSPIEQVKIFRPHSAGLSGIVAMARNHSAQEQLDTIEYLMGRSPKMPPYLEAAAENQSLGPVAQSIRNARQELAEADPMVRVMVANSFLAGPSGLMRTEAGKKAVFAHFMKNVKPQYEEMAGPMFQAVLDSQGDADSLAVAFVLGQSPRKEKLDQADILNRVFDSYGVPGIKMKQYLAFTSEFEDFREAFESAQDAAMPLTYFQVVQLIQKRFGTDWPADLKVDKILGSGSVNIAIRYTNGATGKREVVSLGREDIIEATRYDFHRFQRFVDSLTSTPENAEKFGYIHGLTRIIQDSVKLEFDKEAVLAVQKKAFDTYKHRYNGWTVRSIDAYKVQHLGLFMEEAKGRTARRILDENPKLYREAMRVMAKTEVGLLRGQDSTGNLRPRPNFANPDFHDGQVLIDEPNKTVTILDFGQAVAIDNAERELALDLLCVIGKVDTKKQAAKRLNERFFADKEEPVITPEDLKTYVYGRKKKMDMFVHLLSLLARKGADVPLSTVHWVLGLNRQLVLGEKLGQPIKLQIAGMVLNKKAGLSLGTFNTMYAGTQKVKEWAGALAHYLVPWAFRQEEPEKIEGWHHRNSYAWYPEFE